MITENEFNMLFEAITESCPKLESLKIDIQSLRVDQVSKRAFQICEDPPVVKLQLNKINM